MGLSSGILGFTGFLPMGIMENEMEATVVYEGGYIGIIGSYWAYIGIMENKMEATIMENQMEKKMEHEMETREDIGIMGNIGITEYKMEATIVRLYRV